MLVRIYNLAFLFGFLLIAGDPKAQSTLYPNEFPLGDVTILDGPFKHARDLNIQNVLQYHVDRLLAPYLKEAGLKPRDSSYANWAGLDGHIGGHYLSALAMNVAATHNRECEIRLKYMVEELKACQQANTKIHPAWGIGYAGAVPDSKKIWTALQKGDLTVYRSAWVPWYNLHKTYAGLRDAWLYTGNEDAKIIFLKFCDWAIRITNSLSDSVMQSMLDTEHGGMNEIFADAYQISGNKKYIVAAKRFSHHMLLYPMAEGKDNLDNKHANTQIPKAIGFERIGSLDEDEQYSRAARFFWETVTVNRSIVLGGNSRREFFPAKAACSDFINDVEGPESCNSYNMLKLTEDLFRADPSAKYADYYERTLYNHILSTQHPETGGYVYFTPVRPRSYRVYSAPNQAMWCCVGSGMENHSKYNAFIYTHRGDSLYLNLFIPSVLNWRSRGVEITQQTRFPFEEQTQCIVTRGASVFTLMVRYPAWVRDGDMQISVNHQKVSFTRNQDSYAAIRRNWVKGDTVTITLPMHNSVEHLPNLPEYIAFLRGPIVLAAKTGTEDLKGLVADDSRWGQIPGGAKLPLDKAPVMISDSLSDIADQLVPVNQGALQFATPRLKMINPIQMVFQPFYQIHDARYSIYWMALTPAQYRLYIDSLGAKENAIINLQNRTIDFVAPGEQQPEADHDLQFRNSNTGNTHESFWRDATDSGYFRYRFATAGKTDLILQVRYWGAEWGSRKFEIWIDGQKLISEDNTGRWNQSAFFDLNYPIPVRMLQGRDAINIKFQALPGNTAGAVYDLRVLKK